jgi:hypothetical protein
MYCLVRDEEKKKEIKKKKYLEERRGEETCVCGRILKAQHV